MNKSLFRKVGLTAMAAMLAVPFVAQAESSFQTGAGALSTQARVDFQITIPRFLALQVGTTGAPIDLITFTLTPAQAQTPGPVAGTGGDVGGGAVTARVAGNVGNVTLVAATGGALSNGTDSINWSEITTASTNGALPAPTLTNGTSGAVTVAATGGVVLQTATWTYTYANSATVPGGTYGGVGINNGRVTYTASNP